MSQKKEYSEFRKNKIRKHLLEIVNTPKWIQLYAETGGSEGLAFEIYEFVLKPMGW
jgi:hypothetical protein